MKYMNIIPLVVALTEAASVQLRDSTSVAGQSSINNQPYAEDTEGWVGKRGKIPYAEDAEGWIGKRGEIPYAEDAEGWVG